MIEDELGVVYLVHAPDVGLVKVGATEGDPVKRLKLFQSGSPVELRLVAVLPGGFDLEARLHIWFKDRRSHGEWFEDSILDELEGACNHLRHRCAACGGQNIQNRRCRDCIAAYNHGYWERVTKPRRQLSK